MESQAIYDAIRLSTPTLRDGHGSRHKNKCNVNGCEMNYGKEKHRLTTKEFYQKVNERYGEITRDTLQNRILARLSI